MRHLYLSPGIPRPDLLHFLIVVVVLGRFWAGWYKRSSRHSPSPFSPLPSWLDEIQSPIEDDDDEDDWKMTLDTDVYGPNERVYPRVRSNRAPVPFLRDLRASPIFRRDFGLRCPFWIRYPASCTFFSS
jgi:hypothetical protein